MGTITQRKLVNGSIRYRAEIRINRKDLPIYKEIIDKYPFGEAFFHDENLVFIMGSDGKDKNTFLTKSNI